ncbi:hypothetical protein PA7_25040 [Pseudonocardia asaccharolytica DSM 44247 = NBRC 16224]|uniref:Uncharacterized protein n=1 Tax=Pseudonocardia asaccharolytica DSM 44247 = NBRC 16224 TaxID=1123024 RepID=A0A511D1V6_9PSEU|nr:type I restriction enzyme endonuclease domain-containing protein [Pseudonocardia asaccharolytica]GEL18667.1 hypothetical protein PA7_25040 [Pseudonocardia asaccharolytica DSM 44247 = NBRC 16224]
MQLAGAQDPERARGRPVHLGRDVDPPDFSDRLGQGDRSDVDVAFLAEGGPDPLRLVGELGNRTTGGIIFTTLQKFGRTKLERESGRNHPLLSDRRNIVVIVDEAHRSHYDSLDGYARHLRDALSHATLIAFTGTPLAGADRDTRKVFGDHIDVYDLTRAVEDGATVPVYYESRLIPVQLPEDVDPEEIDERADEVTVGLDDSERTRIQQAVAAMNAVYGAPDRVRTLAADVVEHWENRRARMLTQIDGPGKAMIVCATREICAHLYAEIIARRPDWHSDELDKGVLKVVYTGDPGDPDPIRRHVRRPAQNKVIQQRMKDPDDELEITIVQSTWLTGFDSPPLHTLYLDRPMRGAQLMQTLARVNRRFRNKCDGLLVGYAPLTDNLYRALAEYTVRDQETRPMGRDLDDALAKVRELHQTIGDVILAGSDWRARLAVPGPKMFINTVLGAVEYLRTPGNQGGSEDGEGGDEPLAERFRKASANLARFYALCASTGAMNPYRDDIAYFEALRRLIEQETRRATRHNVVRRQSFSDRLLELMRRYTSQNLSAAEVIAEMVAMAREVAADAARGKRFDPPLTDGELAFYDAVAQNESAVDQMGTGMLADIARDLVAALRRDVTTDWVSRDGVRAKLRTTVKRLLARHGYPPDAQARRHPARADPDGDLRRGVGAARPRSPVVRRVRRLVLLDGPSLADHAGRIRMRNRPCASMMLAWGPFMFVRCPKARSARSRCAQRGPASRCRRMCGICSMRRPQR